MKKRTPTAEELAAYEQQQASWAEWNQTPERQEAKAQARLILALGDAVEALLKEKGMSQRMLAEKMGVPESTVSRLLAGEHNSTLKTIHKLEVALGEQLLFTPLEMKKQIQNAVEVFSERKDKQLKREELAVELASGAFDAASGEVQGFQWSLYNLNTAKFNLYPEPA